MLSRPELSALPLHCTNFQKNYNAITLLWFTYFRPQITSSPNPCSDLSTWVWVRNLLWEPLPQFWLFGSSVWYWVQSVSPTGFEVLGGKALVPSRSLLCCQPSIQDAHTKPLSKLSVTISHDIHLPALQNSLRHCQVLTSPAIVNSLHLLTHTNNLTQRIQFTLSTTLQGTTYFHFTEKGSYCPK